MSSSRRRAAVLGVGVALLATGLAACGGHRKAAAPTTSTTRPTPTVTPTPTPTPTPVPTDPLTGLPGPRRPVTVVKVDNVGVGTQTGLNQADVVYCELVEGGLTRLAAVFSANAPSAVGPVRSARTSDIELLGQYGRVALAFSGANTGVLATVRASNLVDDSYDAHPELYHFNPNRVAPYKFLVDVAALVRAAPGAAAQDVGFRFTPQPGPGGAVSPGLTVVYPSVRMSARWDPARQVYLMFRNGSPLMLDDGSQASATNVLVQSVRIGISQYVDHNHNPTPTSATVGSGAAVLLRGGLRFAGSWVRPSASAGTSWRAAGGGGLSLAPGRTWVLLTPAGSALTAP